MTTARTADITIVGGGIIGCTLAWKLASRGASVTLLERRELAREASWASAGIISPPAPSYGARTALALHSFNQYPDLIRQVETESGLAVGYVATGEVIAGPASDEQALRMVHAWQLAQGLRVEWLDAGALRDREPALHERLSAGIFAADAGSVVLARLTRALALAAARRGATIHEHLPVTGLEISAGRVSAVRTIDGRHPVGTLVTAAGAWSRLLGEFLDFPIPSVPVRGQMIAIAEPPVPIRAVIAAGGGYIVPRADGAVAIGATEEHEAGFDTRVTPAGVAWLVALVERVVPSLAGGRLLDSWAGLRPGTTDGEPIVGRLPHLANAWIATGHFRSGALLAPGTADALVAGILDGQQDATIAPFDPARFA